MNAATTTTVAERQRERELEVTIRELLEAGACLTAEDSAQAEARGELAWQVLARHAPYADDFQRRTRSRYPDVFAVGPLSPEPGLAATVAEVVRQYAAMVSVTLSALGDEAAMIQNVHPVATSRDDILAALNDLAADYRPSEPEPAPQRPALDSAATRRSLLALCPNRSLDDLRRYVQPGRTPATDRDGRAELAAAVAKLLPRDEHPAAGTPQLTQARAVTRRARWLSMLTRFQNGKRDRTGEGVAPYVPTADKRPRVSFAPVLADILECERTSIYRLRDEHTKLQQNPH